MPKERLTIWLMKDPKPPPADIKIDVVNPRYVGSTFEMVARALLRRPGKDRKLSDDEPGPPNIQSST